MGTNSTRVIATARRRIAVARFGRLYVNALLGCFGIALCCIPLLWWYPKQTEAILIGALIAPPIVAAMIAGLFFRRPTAPDGARVVDRAAGTKDLFLSLTELERANAGFGPLVVASAEQASANANVVKALPFDPRRGLVKGVTAALIVVGATLLAPMWDPFGKITQAKAAEEKKEELAQRREAQTSRLEELKREAPEAENSQQIERLTKELSNFFRKTDPTQVKKNARQLAMQQKKFSDEWRARAEKKLAEKMRREQGTQKIGRGQQDEMLRKMSDELKKGKTESLQKELSEMKKELERLTRDKDSMDPVEKEQTLQKLRRRMERMEQLARESGAQQVADMMKKASEQLSAQAEQGMNSEELAALAEEMELSGMEFESLAQSIRDLESLEESLKAMQMAKKLNSAEKLDGGSCEGCSSMADYAKRYAEMLAKMGKGNGNGGDGDGMGGRGQGRGGIAAEDDSVETDYTPENSKSALLAGKLLLSLKTKGEGRENAAVVNYDEQIEAVRDGVSEAILKEQVPPGYHDDIRKYFDTLSVPTGANTDVGYE
ncbi:hypothetical protein [Stratiformator vulcanicus]|uniref:Chromosome partition protein Smc n=1 Tax=Stratiformator vulcanicus TaxID=2527980 RepID=A0A517R0F5_9PLAN|nr:hypothetical protein [Stratiformator vulcanicus]QDT37348.1 hypothetical protein Pan189_17210 [Stratiformator vulcanicus]